MPRPVADVHLTSDHGGRRGDVASRRELPLHGEVRTVWAVMGSEAWPERVPQTSPPNIDQPPASPIEQSKGAGDAVVVVVSGAASAAGVAVEELWHPGATRAA